MRTIQEIYNEYKIVLNLQEHQIRVAAVGAAICEHLDAPVDTDSVIKALLLHDMGNIIKFKLGQSRQLFPERFTEGKLEYWQQVQREFIEKYGKDEHQATLIIMKELGVDQKIENLVECVGFLTGSENAMSSSLERKICAYSDMRVSPHGVVLLEDRIADLHKRYDGFRGYENDMLVEKFDNALRVIEQQIFSHCSIFPGDVTEESVGGFKNIVSRYSV